MRVFIFYLMFLWSASCAWAASDPQVKQVKEANEFFKKGQWDLAIDQYFNALEHNQNADLVQYDLGTAFYKKGNYDQSIEHLQKSISDKNTQVSSQAHYNLGNALYKKARSLENKQIDDAIHSMQKSLESYDKALSINPKDEDAQFNRKFVEKELERLKKKKEEQKQEQKDQTQKDQKQKDQKQEDQKKENQSQDQKQSQAQDTSNKKDKAEENKAQEQKDQEEKKTPQEKKDEEKTANQAKDLSQANESKQPDQGVEEKKSLEEKEAQEVLEEYERQDAPKGILNFMKRQEGEAHVDKDW